MDPRTADQPPLQVSCPARESEQQNSDAVQNTDEKDSPKPQPDVQTDVDTGSADRHQVPSEQNDIHLSGESGGHESEGVSPEPMSTSSEQLQDASSAESTTPKTPNSQSPHHHQDHIDVSAGTMPAHQVSSVPSDSISLNAELPHPRPLPLSESLGWEGCAGILGGFFGLSGVFGFLIFLWFGCK